MNRESLDQEQTDQAAVPPIEDLFSFDVDQVDFMSAESFPASDPPPPQSTITPAFSEHER